MFNEIPGERPSTPLLDRVTNPKILRSLTEEQLPQLAYELRNFLLYTVGQTGGHFGGGLGVVELTIVLHYLFNTPEDRIVWDVGHQAYPHKILTERRELMSTMRKQGGLHAFPKRSESPYDTFGVGHSSTSISAALGMAIASKIKGEVNRRHIAVIGDGAMTAGLVYEALNHAADLKANLLVILNDNKMSISHNVGGLSSYLSKLLTSKTYRHIRESSKKMLDGMPRASELVKRTEEHVKGMVVPPGMLFEELGFNYLGPVDGHSLQALLSTLGNLKDMDGPQLLHVITRKGKGFAPAESNPVTYHAINKLETGKPVSKGYPALKYSNVFGQWLCDMAKKENLLLGITPAMCEGSDMVSFAKAYPERYFDVAIAEQHAVTVAAGMACAGMKPVVAIYSTFLQRGYDQVIHDVALQNLNVLFAIDRAGMVGEDGPTHGGCFDIVYMRCIPNLIIMTPGDENEARQLLTTGFEYNGPAAVRYPRGQGLGVNVVEGLQAADLGKAVIKRNGRRIVFLVFGALLGNALQAAEELDATVVSMRFVKPLDEGIIISMLKKHTLLVTLEEGAVSGGAGSAVNEFLQRELLTIPVMNLGIPDRFIEAGSRDEQLVECGLDVSSIIKSVNRRLQCRIIKKNVQLS